MIDALLWVGGVAVGLTFGYGIGRGRMLRNINDIYQMRMRIQDQDLQINAQRISHNALSSECEALRYALQRAEQRQEHPDTGKHGRYTTAKGVKLRVVVLAVAVHNQTEYAIIVPTELAGATPYMIRLDAVTLDEAGE